MSKNITVTLSLPEHILEQLEQTAAAGNRSLDEVIAEDVLTLYSGGLDYYLPLNTRLDELEKYSDARLRSLVAWRPSSQQMDRYEELVDKREFETISEPEQAELSRWVRLLEHHMVMRSKALVLLQERGIDIQPFLEMADAEDS